MTSKQEPHSPKRPRTLTHELVADLSKRVLAGTLGENGKLPSESSICTEYHVSRTVVREALSKLQAAGLVETRHGIGTFITQSEKRLAFPLTLETLHGVRSVVELRLGLEPQAASMAALRRSSQQLEDIERALLSYREAQGDHESAITADRSFHLAIAEATNNSYYPAIMQQLKNVIIPRSRLKVSATEQAGLSGISNIASAEHDAIYRAIKNQNPEAARAAMWLHLSNSLDRFNPK
ncbi:FadR/GntR family transcriptional regulator [Pseudomonas sp.]|uniref:FadR/GntR family transcriptional regulator n=1 Tax=Pseudomonas sp. TaxID=306 RepID=UPI00258FC1F4|nr:FadR/GntR family transcriptional regulator [Pseudomonas sp.]